MDNKRDDASKKMLKTSRFLMAAIKQNASLGLAK